MKQIYINETVVENVLVDFIGAPRITPRECRKLTCYLKRVEKSELGREKVRFISQIGGIDIDPVAFTFQLRDDGVHLYAPELLDELGAFAGPHGCCFELWAMIKKEQKAAALAMRAERFPCLAPYGNSYAVSERGLARLFGALSPSLRGQVISVMHGLEYQMELDRQRKREQVRVIQFPSVSGRG